MVVQPLHGAIGLQEFDGGLFADPRHSRDVVGRIAHQPEQIDDLLGVFQSVAFTHFLRTPNRGGVAAAARTIHPDLLGHKLGEVLVWRHHEHVEAFLLGTLRKATDQVVCLKPGRLKHRNAHAFEDANDPWNAQLDVFWGLVPVRLVLRKLLVAQRGSWRVKHHRQVGGLFVADDFQKGVGEAKHRRGVHPLGVDAGVLDECVIRAKNQGVRIDEKKLFFGGRGDHGRGFFTRGTALHASPNMRLRTTGPMWAVNVTRVEGPPAVAHPFTMTRSPR